MAKDRRDAASNIFISYRREDTLAHVSGLYPQLREYFGEGRVFTDADTIPHGEDFRDAIEQQLNSCTVFLAIIGKNWLTAQNRKTGTRRVDDPNDPLRLEIANALEREDLVIIPVLVGDATMPTAEDLPPDLVNLAYRNAMKLCEPTDPEWDADVRRLIDAIKRAELEAQRKREIERSVEDAQQRARAALDAGSYTDAARLLDEALALDPAHSGALALKERASAALAERREREQQEGRRQEAERQHQARAAEEARRRAAEEERRLAEATARTDKAREEPTGAMPAAIVQDALDPNLMGRTFPGVSAPAARRSTFARLKAGFKAVISPGTWKRERPRDRHPQPSRAPSPPAPHETPIARQVLLGVSTPRQVSAGTQFIARFVAYIEDIEAAVKQHLRDLDETSTEGGVQIATGLTPAGGGRWREGTPVTVRVTGRYVSAEPSMQSFEWNGRQNLLSFLINVAPDAPGTAIQISFEAFIEGVSVAFIPVSLRIGPSTGHGESDIQTARPASSAFASYASADAPLVALCLSALKRWDPQLDVFMDCLDLTPNEAWQRELERVIPNRDAFLLFWSANAMKSKWVAWELQTATAKKGVQCIRPMPIDDPAIAPPPEELKHLQFRDRYLLARQGFLKLAQHH